MYYKHCWSMCLVRILPRLSVVVDLSGVDLEVYIHLHWSLMFQYPFLVCLFYQQRNLYQDCCFQSYRLLLQVEYLLVSNNLNQEFFFYFTRVRETYRICNGSLNNNLKRNHGTVVLIIRTHVSRWLVAFKLLMSMGSGYNSKLDEPTISSTHHINK